MLHSTHWKTLNNENDASVAFSVYILSKLITHAATIFFLVAKQMLHSTHCKTLNDENDASVAFSIYILSKLFTHAATIFFW